jgi:hypothetical protein
MHMTFNYTNGDFALYRNGWSNAGMGFPQQNEMMAFIESGYKLRLNTALPGSSLEVPTKMFAPGWGKMNLVPLGIIKVRMTYFPNDGYTITASNLSGSLMTNYTGSKNGSTFWLEISLSPSV